jgi:hypothetical protein
MKRAMQVMARSGFTFLGDSEVGKGPNANKRAFNALVRKGYASTTDEGFGPVWRLTDTGREWITGDTITKADRLYEAANRQHEAAYAAARVLGSEARAEAQRRADDLYNAQLEHQRKVRHREGSL